MSQDSSTRLNLELTEQQWVDELLRKFHAARKLAKVRASKNPNSQWNMARSTASCRLPLNGQSRQKVASVVNSVAPPKRKKLYKGRP